MVGMKIVKLNTLKDGQIDMSNLNDLAKKYKNDLACVMITYPSTYGFFEGTVR